MRELDLQTWPRRAVYELFSGCDWPFYQISFPLDVTRLRAYTKKEGLSFYFTLSWLLTKGMQEQEAFRILSLPAGDTIADFSRRTNALNAAQKTLLDPNMESRDDLIYFSCLPWLPVLSLTNERRVDPDDCIPRVGWGKYQEQNGRLTLPVCLEVNHRTVDGLHIGRLYEYVQGWIDKL